MDRFGDMVMAAALAGDGWRRRHDTMKMRILSLLRWAGVEVDCEVFNIFSGLIPQEGLSRLEQGRKPQGLVPRWQVALPLWQVHSARYFLLKYLTSAWESAEANYILLPGSFYEII